MLVTRLMRFVIMLAALLAPLGMIGGARAHPTADHATAFQSMKHCADVQKHSNKQTAPSPDCTIACAAILSASSEIKARLLALAPPDPLALPTSGHGLEPEAETPPPRLP